MAEIIKNSYLKFLQNSGVNTFLQNKPNNFYRNSSNSQNKVISNIEDISSIKQLKNYINCSNKCKLKKLAKKTVVGEGNKQAKIMLIGEAPGAEEDSIGMPFVGAAGKLLTKMLLAINLKREDIYITNVIPWRPPNNRAPSNEEILQCLPFVQKSIELVNPSFILLLGSTAAKSILTTTLSITKLRGKWYQYNHPNLKKEINCLVTYHPAFLLRSPNYKKNSWVDLKIFQQKILNEKN